MSKFKLLLVFLFLVAVAFLTPRASAHVTVKPAEVGVATYQTFNVSVPNEKDVNVTALRLLVPKGLESVSPTVKQGWNIETVKDGDQVTEIKWTGGIIPSGQRDDFTFSAKTPGKQTDLKWKAYQTYEDGTIVAWDQDPASEHGDDDEHNMGPYSTTKIIDDLKQTSNTPATEPSSKSQNVLTWAALALSIVAISMTLMRKK